MLAYLALNRGRPVCRDDLVRAVWGDDAHGHGGDLSSLLSRLRRLLGDGTIIGKGAMSVQLAAGVGVDFHDARASLAEAEDAVRSADAETAGAAARRTTAITRRGLLVGQAHEWLEAWRSELSEIDVRARECIVEAVLTTGGPDLPAAIECARELVAAEPYRESAYALLMRALAAQGNVAQALRVYDEMRVRLRDELALAPGPRLRALHGQLLGEASTVAPPSLPDRPSAARVPPPMGLPRSDGDLVGRTRELRVLRLALEQTVDRRCHLVLLEGQAGIGKTRLALHFAQECRRAGGPALYGRCDAETLQPYQPFVEALRRHLSTAPASGIGMRIPDLRLLLPELAADASTPRPDSGDRHRVVDAVCMALAEVASGSPLLLVLDDLHWADTPTLLILRQILRCLTTVPVLILAGYRPADRGEALAGTLADLRREHGLGHITLQGLDCEAASALVAQLDGPDISATVVQSLWERSHGNPLFLKELVRQRHERERAGDDVTDERLPEAVKAIIGQRLALLSHEARTVLEVACVAGSEVPIELFEALCGLSEDALDVALREVVEAGMLVEREEIYGRFAFEHSLFRQSLYEELTCTRRARLHLRVGEALDALGAPHAELAHHFGQAPPSRGRARAHEHAALAGHHALSVLAFEDAVRHYEQALVGCSGEHRFELLLALGGAQARAGELARARASFQEAAELARELAAPRGLARAALGCGIYGRMAGGVVDGALVEMLEEALAGLNGSDPVLRSRLLARLAIELRFTHDLERLGRLIDEAIALARGAADPAALGDALVARHWSLWAPENVDERLDTARELAAADHHRLKLQGHRWRVIDLLEVGDMRRVEAEIEAYATVALPRRQPADLWHVHLFQALRLLLAGDYGRADVESHAAYELGRRVGDVNAHQGYVLQQLALRRDRGGLEAVEDGVRENVRRFPAIPGWRCALALLLCELTRLDEARAHLDDLARDHFAAIPRDGLWLGALACLAEAAATLAEQRHAAVLYELLRPFGDRTVTLGFAAACCGSASRPLALLASTLERDEADAHFAAALAAHERMGARPWVARTRIEYGRARGDPELERCGLAEAKRLGMRIYGHGSAGRPAA